MPPRNGRVLELFHVVAEQHHDDQVVKAAKAVPDLNDNIELIHATFY